MGYYYIKLWINLNNSITYTKLPYMCIFVHMYECVLECSISILCMYECVFKGSISCDEIFHYSPKIYL